MDSLYVKGVRRTLLYYFAGLFTAGLFHLVAGGGNAALVPRSMLILLFTIMAALPWVLLNIINLLSKQKDIQSRGELLGHCITFLLFAIFFIEKILW
jgi:hypothetical protein